MENDGKTREDMDKMLGRMRTNLGKQWKTPRKTVGKEG